MADQNRPEVRQMLVAKRDALDLELRNKTKTVIASGTDSEAQRIVGDEAEVADQNAGKYTDSVFIRMKRQTLEKLNEAIRRLDEGGHGICSDCGDEISSKRLEALPFATRCTDCERNREEREESFKRSSHESGPSHFLYE